MDSDESDFYGDEKLVDDLESRVQSFDVDSWREERKKAGNLAIPARQPNSLRPPHQSRLHNPLSQLPHCAWQLTESVEAFLQRLRPSITDITPEIPWIWIANPYLPGEPSTIPSSGNGHDGADVKCPQIQSFTSEAMQILNDFRDVEEHSTGKVGNRILGAAHIGKLRGKLASDILDLAHKHNVLSGKWMLFCDPDLVDDVWGAIAKATARNELGIMAKVSPREEGADRRKQRLICVYTANFQDKKDVTRVLQRLRSMGLGERTFGNIYYKPDAYTHVGIARDNPWKIPPTLYSSSGM